MLSVKNCFTYAYSAGTFSDFQFDTKNESTGQVTNVIDLIGASSPSTIHINEGQAKLTLHILVTEAFATGTEGVSFILFNHTSATDISGGKAIWDSGILGVSQLPLGQQINVTLPAGKYSRYLGMDYVVESTATSAGKVVMWIDEGVEPDATLLDMDDSA